MFCSDEQSHSIRIGYKGDPSWSVIDLPIGRQEIPTWATGLHIWWGDGFGNIPRFTLKTNTNLRKWENKRFTRDKSLFLAVSDDGRAEAYYQSSPLVMDTVKRFFTPEGQMKQYPDQGDNWGIEPGEWRDVERLCTRQEDGFAGAHIDILMSDGAEATMRGPWHGPCPAGFVELAYINTKDDYYLRSLTRPRWIRPWHQHVGTGGLFLRQEVFIPIFARFAAHLRLAAVDEGNGIRLQPLKPEWDEPKAWILARERYARKLELYNSTPEAQRPPYVECNFPKACAGRDHCYVAECNWCTKKRPEARR